MHLCSHAKRRLGFTLMELSVVLVILALIIGGIVMGTSLIRSSELQAAISESIKYTQAIANFRSKYRALPGDFAKATDIWGEADSGSDCYVEANPSNQYVTCNGDGNGNIITRTDYNDTYYEQFRAWQHLSNAGFIEGGYSGISATGSRYAYTIGRDIPASKLTAAGWRVLSINVHDIETGDVPELDYIAGDIPYNVVLWLGGNYMNDNSLRMTAVLKSEEAYDIDSKIDDGIPNRGKVVGQNYAGVTDCHGSNVYTIQNSLATCALVFKTGH